MREAANQRLVWLFLFAIAVPSVAVAWIGARLIRQDQELVESRRIDEQRRIVGDHAERPDLAAKYTAFLEDQFAAHQAMAQLFTAAAAVPLTPAQLESLRALGYIQ